MSDTTYSSYRTDFTECDIQQFNYNLGSLRRDDDEDSYSPDDLGQSSHDCDDIDPWAHPGANVDCDALGVHGYDIDCDGTADATECGSPLLLDLAGDGLKLTSRAAGVNFDLDGDGVLQSLSWTQPNSDDAWLVLDRNGNGRVDNGRELFGSYSPQAPSSEPNGFLALTAFDVDTAGGNGDGVVDSNDLVFSQLRLWRDANHNGRSDPGELLELGAVGIKGLHLDYRESRRRDEWGNLFRFKARIISSRSSDVAKWAFDVFLVLDDSPVQGGGGGRR